MTRTSVLLTTDGTYPCYRGGVSVWCDQLIRQLPDIDFHIFGITYSPSDRPVFSFPENVRSREILPLWGTEEPGPSHPGLKQTLLRKLRTSRDRIQSQFIGPFETMLRCIMSGGEPEALAEAFLSMHVYFAEHDYAATVSSREVWNAFARVSQEEAIHFTLEEATRCMRWLQRYLAVTAVQLPATDIIHASMAGLAGVAGVIQKATRGSSFILTEHGIYLRELYISLGRMRESTRCRKFLFGWFEAVARMNYHYCDTVTSLCEFNKEWQIRMGAKADRIHIIPNGVDPAVFYPGPEKTERSVPVVLTMARIYPLKGIDHLLRAARLVLDQMPEVRWRILGEVGDREYHAHCLNLAGELNISQSIEWSQTPDPASAYRRADVFCLPSISEATPYSVLEAMFSSCPVVATAVGGVAEMLGNTGLVVPPRRPQDMARALLSLLQGPGAKDYRSELGAKARQRALSTYTIEKCSTRFRETYDHISHTRAARMSAAQ